MYKILRYIVIAVIALGTAINAEAAETADAILKKSAKAINEAGGLTASFTLDYGTQKVTGTLKASGRKFTLQTASNSTWYDGKSMWTYNSRNNETTLMTPTAQEVGEANPLSIVNSYSSSFTAAFAKSQSKGSKTIVLTPKSKHLGYKSVHVTIPDGSSYPSRLVIIPTSGQKVTVSISQVKTGVKLDAATFTYPKSKYPKAEIVDLR
ncbi:MAG: outer-membrane lipoprotein carrier protein LolA [Muribaculaceae bacterium]|nr:outer-membrane lipoprotein carrier protein LolA [Muribaculaceae bacterium]MDE6553718.1 outer-membrane lipoprotein carrier protein LolA [Muribaculaceae bacterium]